MKINKKWRYAVGNSKEGITLFTHKPKMQGGRWVATAGDVKWFKITHDYQSYYNFRFMATKKYGESLTELFSSDEEE